MWTTRRSVFQNQVYWPSVVKANKEFDFVCFSRLSYEWCNSVPHSKFCFCFAFSGHSNIRNLGTQGDDDTGSQVLDSSCLTDSGEELRIVSVHGRGEGPLQEMSNTLFSSSELQALNLVSPDDNVTHDSLLNFTTGTTDKAPERGMQDNSTGKARNSQLETNHSTQTPSTALIPPVGTPLVGADSQAGSPSHISQFSQQQNVFPHTVNKPLDCSFCGKFFLSREDLITHRATHTGETPIPCSFCGKSFVNKTTLTIHMRIHTGEKPYACAQCGKRFTQNGSLKIHLRTHSGEKPYTCNQCTASFNNPSNLRRHMITHSIDGVLWPREGQRLFQHVAFTDTWCALIDK